MKMFRAVKYVVCAGGDEESESESARIFSAEMQRGAAMNESDQYLVLSKLSIPLPNGSAFAAAAGLVVLPKYWICQAWNGVHTVM